MLRIVSWCYNLNIKEGRWTRYMEQHWNYVQLLKKKALELGVLSFAMNVVLM